MRSEVRRTVWGLLLVATLCPILQSYSQPTPGRSYEEVVVNECIKKSGITRPGQLPPSENLDTSDGKWRIARCSGS